MTTHAFVTRIENLAAKVDESKKGIRKEDLFSLFENILSSNPTTPIYMDLRGDIRVANKDDAMRLADSIETIVKERIATSKEEKDWRISY